MGKSHILIVDDDESMVKTLVGILRDEGFVVSCVSNGNQALAFVHTEVPDLILLDIWLPGMDGIETLRALKRMCADVEVIMMSGHGSIKAAVEATKLGAFDYVEKPLSVDGLVLTVRRALHHREFRRHKGTLSLHRSQTPSLIGDSPQIKMIRQQVGYAWVCDEPVLIQGEPGSEKEWIARLLHKGSERREGPFVYFHSAGLSGIAMERMLFGVIGDLESWERAPSRGYLELANGGTIFLDGIDFLQHEIQDKLLQAMTTRMLQRVGGKIPIPHNVRLIASCDTALDQLQAQHRLLPGLAKQFQLCIEVPPLRERKADIPALVHHFLRVFATRYGDPLKEIDDEAMAVLLQYDWPGNVEELKCIIEQMVVAVPASRLGAPEVSAAIRDACPHKFPWDHSWRTSYPGMGRDGDHTSISNHRQHQNRRLGKTPRSLQSLRPRINTGQGVSPQVHPARQRKQRTLRRSMVIYGQGLQSGLKTGMILSPLPPNSGILFRCITTGEMIPASIDCVESTDFSTSLRKGRFSARTVEHLMSVLHAYRISNLLVKISDEVPIMDGSAADLCRLIEEGGIEEQEVPAEEFIVDRCYHVDALESQAKSIMIEPYDGFRVTYRLDYPQPLGVQEFTYEHRDGASYRREIAPARTFAFVREVEKMHNLGLVAGGRLNNVILLDDGKIVNSVRLRFPDECARHKVLDIIGDLYLLGMPIRGHVRANMTGHTENVALVRTLRDVM
jgi:two-component system nitrogen regulation response regulator NtrX